MILFRIATAILAFAFIFFGVIAMIAPTPFGFVLVFMGILLLSASMPGVLRWWRRFWPWLDRRLDAIQENGPRWLRRLLRRSDPQDDEDSENDDKDDATGYKTMNG